MNRKYSDEFKLKVVQDYYASILGFRVIAKKYGLPSKNYITIWEQQLIKKNLLPKNSRKKKMTNGNHDREILNMDERTPREKQYEEENIRLKAEIAYLKSLESLKPFLKKK